MKTKWIGLLCLAGLALVAAAVARAGGSGGLQIFSSDLVLRPGVSQAVHPAVAPHGLYGGFDATYNPGNGKFAFTLDYKSLRGTVTRVELRSRHTGTTYGLLCGPCRPRVFPHASHEGRAVFSIGGVFKIDPDAAFLIAGDRTFVQVDTTAYPNGEIGGPIVLYVPPVVKKGQPPVVKDLPRCC